VRAAVVGSIHRAPPLDELENVVTVGGAHCGGPAYRHSVESCRRHGGAREGTIYYKIGDLPIFDAVQGDVVFVPRQMWHRAHHGGTGCSTRLAMNGYPQLLHNYQPKDEMR
jgi:hypothetical protein